MASRRWKLKTLALEHLGISVVDMIFWDMMLLYMIYIYIICSVKVMSRWWNISDEIFDCDRVDVDVNLESR